jgi:Protein of unknown function (DUF3467)
MSDECAPSEDAGSLRARYANYFAVGHNAFEFVLDFGQHYPESRFPDPTKAPLHTRIITVPVYARVLLDLLRDSVTRHEALFGPIPSPTERDEKWGAS